MVFIPQKKKKSKMNRIATAAIASMALVADVAYGAGDGSVLSTIEINDSTTNGPTLSNGDNFGSSVANIGDLNGDGVNDFAVGALGDDSGGNYRGALHILFMNTDGTVDSTVEINDLTTNGPVLSDVDRFGSSVANIGDLNGDGVQDLAVGATHNDGGGDDQGALHILFMNTDGSVDSTVEINYSTTNGPTLSDYNLFGSSVANIGDLNEDGVNDIAVGAKADYNDGEYKGALHILFMNIDGSVDSTVEINSLTTNGPYLPQEGSFGSSVANIGDLNGDGVQDLAVGAMRQNGYADYTGAIHILFMNTDGSVDSTVEIDDTTSNGPTLLGTDNFGSSVANIGDLNGDGVQDLAVGARNDYNDGGYKGALHILFMNIDGSVDSTIEINDGTANGPVISNYDQFGSSVANIGDLNEDGVNDIVVGAQGDDNGGSGRGALHVIFMAPLAVETSSGGPISFTNTSCSVSNRTPEIGEKVTFETSINTSDDNYEFEWTRVLDGDDENTSYTFNSAGEFYPRGEVTTDMGTEIVNCGTISVSEEDTKSSSPKSKDPSFSDIISKYKDFLKTLYTLGINLPQNVVDMLNVKTPEVTTPSQTLTTDLELGDSHPEVKLLQQFLNNNGYTVADTGPGSKGNETEMFGYATQAALIRFQQAKNITPAVGYFGSITRNFVNNI